LQGIENGERRKCQRYPLALSIRYRVTPRNAPPLAGGGTTRDISPNGLSFVCPEELPVGSHIEMVAEWPAKGPGKPPLDLRMTGFVVRSNHRGAAVLVTSHRLCAEAPEAFCGVGV